jgi:hypothetical protein
MITPKNVTPTQLDWLVRMHINIETLHEQWYGSETGFNTQGKATRNQMDQALFTEVDNKIRSAAVKLKIPVPDVTELAAANEFWDGERFGPLMVLATTLDSIVKHFINKDIGARPDPQAEVHNPRRKNPRTGKMEWVKEWSTD